MKFLIGFATGVFGVLGMRSTWYFIQMSFILNEVLVSALLALLFSASLATFVIGALQMYEGRSEITKGLKLALQGASTIGSGVISQTPNRRERRQERKESIDRTRRL